MSINTKENEQLIKSLLACVQQCNYCADSCLDSGYVEMMIDCIRTSRICAEVCNTTAIVLNASYDDVYDLVMYCKNLCEACAKECRKHDHHYCKNCVDACMKSIEACQEFTL